MSVFGVFEEIRHDGDSQWVLGKASINKLVCETCQIVSGGITRHALGVMSASRQQEKRDLILTIHGFAKYFSSNERA
jgi:hypothetical protein